MSATQYQHYAPRSYLKGWAVEGKLSVTEWRHNKLVTKAKSPGSTGGRDGLYYVPMAPEGKRNFMEDVFWRDIDQWGADGLALMRDKRPEAAAKVHLGHLAIFINSFAFRNPVTIKQLNEVAKNQALSGCLSENYAAYRYPHEPDTLEGFKARLNEPFLCEFGAQLIRKLVCQGDIIDQLLSMKWQVVSLTGGEPVLTSDNPLIRYKGMKDDDGAWILPLSRDEVFIAYNEGKFDMVGAVEDNVRTGNFVEGINKFVVRSKIDAVYGAEPSQMDFVARHFSISETPVVPGFAALKAEFGEARDGSPTPSPSA